MRKLQGSSVWTDTNEKQTRTLRPVDTVGVEGTGVEGILQLIYSLNATQDNPVYSILYNCAILCKCHKTCLCYETKHGGNWKKKKRKETEMVESLIGSNLIH